MGLAGLVVGLADRGARAGAEERSMRERGLGVVMLLAALAAVARPAQARPTWVKKAQSAGFPEIKNCLECHTRSSGRDLNARGQFLHDKMKAAGVKEPDFQWLKEYKEPDAATTATAETPTTTPTTEPQPEAR
jgi:hypothetical protein